MAPTVEIGQKGEMLAAEHLVRKGYKLISLNWRYKHKEIDILAYDQHTLVVVEVKLRSSSEYGEPSEFVTLKKQRFLVEAAEAYLETLSTAPEVRFDIVSIVGHSGNFLIDHIEDAFNPS